MAVAIPLLLALLLLAGCTAVPIATPSVAITAPPAPATPTAGTSTSPPTAAPTATPVPRTVYTVDDTAIAKLIKAGADEAIPQLKVLNDMDPSKLEHLFLPLGVWIDGQKAGVEAFTPSGCTTAAVALFLRGIDEYDAIRELFLAWRDWGANGRPFAFSAPGQVVLTFEEALVELEAHCPAPT